MPVVKRAFVSAMTYSAPEDYFTRRGAAVMLPANFPNEKG
ncbi:hypothetical protein BN134_56 [Cronobacter dublinensis 1210]|uniref:Uncharacterized protein n=1 Tax=Cronobacter dublinensis 1210 TaxID=1208656 RepID=A0ABM9Q1W5_9ENTR|nr:hypothetical protein BN134_56 [Cronobacter dublinensis 1210]